MPHIQVECGIGSWIHPIWNSGSKVRVRDTNLGGISILLVLVSEAIGLDEITKGMRE